MRVVAALLVLMTSGTSLGGSKAELLAGHRFAQDCDAGISSYEKTVYPIVMTNCIGCHSAAGPGPAFALQDVRDSYFAIKNYVNFNDVATSRLRIRAGNSHCGPTCNTDMGDEVEGAINDWWLEGERTCASTGRYFTGSLAVPADLPREQEGFMKLRWPLVNVNAGLAGYFVEIEAQLFAEATEEMPGAYLFRAPRLVGSDKSFHVQGIRILVNRQHDVLASNFTYIDAHVGPQDFPQRQEAMPYPVMSSDRMIVLQDLAEGDQLSVSFEVFEEAAPLTCSNVPMFVDNVMPTAVARNCFGCHGGGRSGGAGFEPANQVFFMGVSEEKLCEGFLQRASSGGPQPAPAIAYPLLGVNGHPRIFISGDEVYPYWTPWIDSEAGDF